ALTGAERSRVAGSKPKMNVRGTGLLAKKGPSISKHPFADSHPDAASNANTDRHANDRCMRVTFAERKQLCQHEADESVYAQTSHDRDSVLPRPSQRL